MINPNKLKAMAGWAISKLSGASDAQAVALHKFKSGCAALAEDCPEETRVVPPCGETSRPRSRQSSAALTKSPVVERHLHPPEVQQQHCDETGQHRFDIRTQHCVFCGESYRKVMGRQPELMR